MAVTIKMLFVTVVFCAIAGIAFADGNEYIDCVLDGVSKRETEIEAFIQSLNNSLHGKDVTERCASLNERIARCEAKKTNWPSTLTKPWAERMKDPVYVDFLMTLGKEFCRSPQQLEEIRNCFTDELQAAVKSCVTGGRNPDVTCIQDQYRKVERCPDSADNFFAVIIQGFLSRNPYLGQSAQTTPITKPADQNEYIECILEGVPKRETEIEAFISSLNNSLQGKDVAERCASLNERIARCEAKKTNWPSTLTKPWAERMKDPVYVDFLVTLGKEFCGSPQQLEEIRKCFTDELQAAVKICVTGGPNPNLSCVLDQYKKIEQCSDSADNSFAGIAQTFLSRNPYWSRSIQATPRTEPAVSDHIEYIECIWEGNTEKDSEIEAFIFSLNNTQHGKDVAERCASLNERIARCEGKQKNWPSTITKPWAERMKDPVYVRFLMTLAQEFCKSPQQLEEIRICFTDELQTAVKSCVTGGHNPDVSCPLEQYRKVEKCPASADNFFAAIAQAFRSRNPYGTQTVQGPPQTEPSRTEPTGQCQYVECVLEGNQGRNSEVEMYLGHFMAQQPDNIPERCKALTDRTVQCESKKANCQTTISKPWEERMKDPVYVEFLMSLGKEFCKNPQQLKDLRNCFTEELHTAIQGCLPEGPNFNASCVHQEYNKLEKCESSSDEFFAIIFKWFLSNNPYRTQSSQVPSPSTG